MVVIRMKRSKISQGLPLRGNNEEAPMVVIQLDRLIASFVRGALTVDITKDGISIVSFPYGILSKGEAKELVLAISTAIDIYEQNGPHN